MKYYRGFKRSELNFAETNISKLLSRMLNEKKKKSHSVTLNEINIL